MVLGPKNFNNIYEFCIISFVLDFNGDYFFRKIGY